VAIGKTGLKIRGPGIVQNFKGHGIVLNNTTASTISGATTATNCLSGIFLTANSSLNELDGNISVRNGNGVAPCGGI
jgi:nitrous oxidase accessory protein NosD